MNVYPQIAWQGNHQVPTAIREVELVRDLAVRRLAGAKLMQQNEVTLPRVPRAATGRLYLPAHAQRD